MALQTYSFSALVSNFATAVQASASSLFDFTVGSVLRALGEATAGVALWLQAIIVQLLTLTRAATSQSTDLDTWMADFNLLREVAVAATGQVTFSRFTATQQALIPVGATIQTADGTQNFSVEADTTNTAYDAAQNGYILPANTASISVPVMATVAGTGGNVQANTVTVITTPIPYVDTVTNAAAFANGLAAETDPAFRQRFVLYLASLSKGTKTAIQYAVTNVRQGLTYTLTENEDYDGNYDPGFFYVVVDDGTGDPSDELVSSVYNAIDAMRGFTITFAVFKPVVVTANVSMTVTSASGFTHADVVGAVGTALSAFITALPLGTSLPYTQLAAVAYGVAGVNNVSAILLNAATSDLSASQKQKIVAGTITIA